MKSLVLRPRMVIDGKVNWHDAYAVQLAIERIAENKPISKAALWLSIAGKIQFALEDDADFCGHNVPNKELVIELNNTESRKLCEEMMRLEPKHFGRDSRTGQPSSPNPGTLFLMLKDIAVQLGYQVLLESGEDQD